VWRPGQPGSKQACRQDTSWLKLEQAGTKDGVIAARVAGSEYAELTIPDAL
jgi:hypothetical protein